MAYKVFNCDKTVKDHKGFDITGNSGGECKSKLIREGFQLHEIEKFVIEPEHAGGL